MKKFRKKYTYKKDNNYSLSEYESYINMNKIISKKYDNKGRIAEIEDAWGDIVKYSYDENDRIIREEYDDGLSNEFYYDRKGNIEREITIYPKKY